MKHLSALSELHLGQYFSRRNDTLGFAVDTTFAYPRALNTSPRGELDPTGSHAGVRRLLRGIFQPDTGSRGVKVRRAG